MTSPFAQLGKNYTMRTNEEFDHSEAWKYEHVGETYDKKRFSSWPGRRFHTSEVRAIRHLLSLAEKQGPITSVLDLPCGTGRISKILGARGHDLTCSDISVPMLKAARLRLDADNLSPHYAAGNIYNLPFADKAFDCVTCIRLFQHLTSEESIRALIELSRVSSRYVLANFMYAGGYYAVIRKLRQATNRYAPRYTITSEFMTQVKRQTPLTIVQTRMPQRLYSGNLVVLFENETR